MTRAQLLDIHKELSDKARGVMEKKNHDYAGAETQNPFANFTSCEAQRICSTAQGMLVRMSDKMARLITFATDGELRVSDETFDDSAIDLINYAVLFVAYHRSKRKELPDKDLINILHKTRADLTARLPAEIILQNFKDVL